jgi:CD2 antigen cytoplasmic tail-binding protein 2
MEDGDGHSKQPRRTVRFAASDNDEVASKPVSKRSKQGDDEEDDYEDDESRRILEAKRQRRLRQKLEADDALVGDDDDNEEDSDVEEDDIKGPSRKEQFKSLRAEGIAVEPFHMRNEEGDGSGYFDGDTYVFRRNTGDDGEPDAWLDGLDDPENEASQAITTAAGSRGDQEESAGEYDNVSTQDLYQQMMALMSPLKSSETVLQAIARYGNEIKQERTKRGNHNKRRRHDGAAHADSAPVTTQHKNAQDALNQLTMISNTLLLRHGQISIFDQTRETISALLLSELLGGTSESTKRPEQQNGATVTGSMPGDTTRSEKLDTSVQWEYQGREDQQIHGPYTTQQMLDWTRAGYFVGPSAVYVRTVATPSVSPLPSSSPAATTTTTESLLADLMDDDDDDEKPAVDEPKGTAQVDAMVCGEWQWSDGVNFAAYE